MRIILLLHLLLIAFLLAVLVPACNNPVQPVQANTAPAETTIEPAAFSVSNLSIEPSDSSGLCDILNIGTDEEIIISVTVTNTNISQQSQDIVLYVDFVEVETKSVTLAAGDSEKIEFDLLWGTSEEGIYTVTIEGLQAIFGVG